MNCRGLKTLLNVARKQLVIEKRAKKTRHKPGFCNTKNAKINVLRIVDAYALCEDPLSYVQRDVRHE